jgi:enoyl-CoA hydratase/carnithine racemase
MAGAILRERRGAVVELRVSNPAKYNAMSLGMWLRLAEEVRAVALDPAVRVLLLRGEGDRAFVSGADISEFDSVRSAESGSGVYDRAVEDAQDALIALPVPVVAAVQGICMGGGLGLAMACDLRYVAATATFRMPAARLGLGYSYSGLRRMTQVLGPSRVADLFMTARTFDGREAERMGIASRCFAQGSFEEQVEESVTGIADNAPLTLKLAKAGIGMALAGASAEELRAYEAARQACVRSEDYREGRQAFGAKRTPRFTGR